MKTDQKPPGGSINSGAAQRAREQPEKTWKFRNHGRLFIRTNPDDSRNIPISPVAPQALTSTTAPIVRIVGYNKNRKFPRAFAVELPVGNMNQAYE